LDLGSEIQDIRPNPATDRNGLIAVLLENMTIQMINMDGTVAATLSKHKYTAMAWSNKGKQIMCGTDKGRLYQIDPEGVLKKEHLPNPANDGRQGKFLSTMLLHRPCSPKTSIANQDYIVIVEICGNSCCSLLARNLSVRCRLYRSTRARWHAFLYHRLLCCFERGQDKNQGH
jgi:hypothetical protein